MLSLADNSHTDPRLDYSHNRFGHISRFERKSSQVGRLDGTDGCGILPSCATSIHGGKTDTAALMADSIGQKEAFAASSAQDAVIPKPKSVQCCRWEMSPRNPISKTTSFPPGQRMSYADLVFSAQEAKTFPTRPRAGPRRRALHLCGKPLRSKFGSRQLTPIPRGCRPKLVSLEGAVGNVLLFESSRPVPSNCAR